MEIERDIFLQFGEDVVPIAVKSEGNVKAKSLSLYRERYKLTAAVRFSTRNLRRDGGLLNVPLYLADKLDVLLQVARDEDK